MESSEADEAEKANYQEVLCYDSDDFVLDSNFEPTVSDVSKHSDPEEEVLHEAPKTKKYIPEKSLSKDATKGQNTLT